MPKTTGLTYEDLLEMFPEESNRRHELIGGELIVPPAPSTRHQLTVTELVIRLGSYGRELGGRVFPAPTDLFLTDRDVVQPDVLYVAPRNVGRVEHPFVRGAPDLVVEVSSPSTRRTDLGLKKDLYERHGVPEHWFVDLEADRVEVYRLREGRYERPVVLGRGDTLESVVLPGFSAPVDELLGPPAP